MKDQLLPEGEIKMIKSIRDAFESVMVKESGCSFSDFPRGSCLDASIITGKILQERGYGIYSFTINCWKNFRGNAKSHSWLIKEVDMIGIDITADQFNCWRGKNYNPVRIWRIGQEENTMNFNENQKKLVSEANIGILANTYSLVKKLV